MYSTNSWCFPFESVGHVLHLVDKVPWETLLKMSNSRWQGLLNEVRALRSHTTSNTVIQTGCLFFAIVRQPVMNHCDQIVRLLRHDSMRQISCTQCAQNVCTFTWITGVETS